MLKLKCIIPISIKTHLGLGCTDVAAEDHHRLSALSALL
jgi:hypothetical protein